MERETEIGAQRMSDTCQSSNWTRTDFVSNALANPQAYTEKRTQPGE